MKKSFFLTAFAIVSLLSVINANATIRRVGYFGIYVSGIDYGDLQSAINAAAHNDTIYIYPGSWSASVYSKVTLISYGYFNSGANSNAGLQNIIGSLDVNVYIGQGADSSLFQGIDILSVHAKNGSTNNIVIDRCHCYMYYRYYTQDRWQIKQSYIENITWQYNQGAIFTNLLVSNCYINNFNFGSTTSGASSGILSNNIFDGTTNFQNCPFSIKSCIFISSHANDAYCMYQYNVATAAYPLTNTGNDTANKNVNNVGNVFIGYPNLGTYSYDGRFALKASSPAIGAGEGGTDAGIYGGSDPYRLSGIPPIPAFYKLTAPSTTTSGNPYTITFSVRSNN